MDYDACLLPSKTCYSLIVFLLLQPQQCIAILSCIIQLDVGTIFPPSASSLVLLFRCVRIIRNVTYSITSSASTIPACQYIKGSPRCTLREISTLSEEITYCCAPGPPVNVSRIWRTTHASSEFASYLGSSWFHRRQMTRYVAMSIPMSAMSQSCSQLKQFE